jgi:hypothetical protein
MVTARMADDPTGDAIRVKHCALHCHPGFPS